MRSPMWTTLLLISAVGCTDMGDEVADYHNKILFTSRRSGKDQLYMINPNGTGMRQITLGPYFNRDGRWSPDASQIVCNAEEFSTTAGLMMKVFNSDGTNARYLVQGHQMAWSPNGRAIAFSHCPSCELGGRSNYIFLFDLDANSIVQLTFAEEEVRDNIPSWSADGKTLFFSSNRHAPGFMQPEIYRMNRNGSELQRLTYTPNGSSVSPSVSPSGQMIAFVSVRDSIPMGGVFIMMADGSGARLIAQPPTGEVFNYPRWSRDGKKLVMVSGSTDGTQRTWIYVVNSDGGNLVRLLNDDSSVGIPDWSW